MFVVPRHAGRRWLGVSKPKQPERRVRCAAHREGGGREMSNALLSVRELHTRYASAESKWWRAVRTGSLVPSQAPERKRWGMVVESGLAAKKAKRKKKGHGSARPFLSPACYRRAKARDLLDGIRTSRAGLGDFAMRPPHRRRMQNDFQDPFALAPIPRQNMFARWLRHRR